MPPRSGEELATELESRQESRIMRALEMVAPGTSLREGIDNIVDARTGALIVIGDADELGFLFSGGIKLDIDYSPAFRRSSRSRRARVTGPPSASPSRPTRS